MRQVMALAMMTATVLSALTGATQSTGQVVSIQPMTTPRAAHSATLLMNGHVLIAGGCTQGTCDSGPATQTAEIFDPQTRGFTVIGRLVQPRLSHAAVQLEDGAVMLLGGWVSGRVTVSTERFDPTTGTFNSAPDMLEPRADFSATVLKDGRVLIAGGYRNRTFVDTAEISAQQPFHSNRSTERPARWAHRCAPGRWSRTAGGGQHRTGSRAFQHGNL
jgi:hypothetical protein